MAKYRNRGGRIVTLDPNNRDVIHAVAEKEYFLIEEEKKEIPTPVKKVVEKPVIVKEDKLDKKELTIDYVNKFNKKPFPGWSAEILRDKIGE